jgi:hypothetical protein
MRAPDLRRHTFCKAREGVTCAYHIPGAANETRAVQIQARPRSQRRPIPKTYFDPDARRRWARAGENSATKESDCRLCLPHSRSSMRKIRQCRSRLCALTEVTHPQIETETYERDKKMVRGWVPHDSQLHPRPENLTSPCACIISMRTRAKTITPSENKASPKPYLAELGLWSLTASERTSADLGQISEDLGHINAHKHAIYVSDGLQHVVWDQNGHCWPI